MRTMRSAPFVLRGWHVLVMMLAFFGAVIAVNVTFAVVAVRSFPGEDVRRSYLQGVNYNETINARRAQAALGWSARAALSGAVENVQLVVALKARDGAPIDGAALTGELRWPTDSRRDRVLTFTPLGGGLYAADLGALARGRWRLRARAGDTEGGALDFESELTWPLSQ